MESIIESLSMYTNSALRCILRLAMIPFLRAMMKCVDKERERERCVELISVMNLAMMSHHVVLLSNTHTPVEW